MNCDLDAIESIDIQNGSISLKGLTDVCSFANSRNRWYTNEEIASILLKIDSHCDWLTNELQIRPKSGAIILYSRKQVRYRQDGYCWKKRKNGKTTREDHMKLKVQGIECIYGCYVHSAILPTFHRRCYWLLTNPDIVLVHYLNNPSNEQNKMQTFNPGLILADTNRQWSDQEIMEEIGSMFGGVEEAYKMLSDAPSSYRTNNDNSDQTDAEFRNLDLINQVDISSVVKDFNRKDHNDNRPTSANQNMDVNVAVLFDDKSSQQSSSIINVACGTSELIASGRDNDYCCVIDRGHECGNSINDPSFVSDSCGQDEQMISVSRLLDQDFNQTSNNHIDSNQTNQDNKCKNIHENNMSHIEINNDLMRAKDLIDSINEKRCEQLNDKLDDLELYAPIAISPKMDSNCSIDIGIYSKMRGGMDTLTALPLDELHQSQQEDLNCISRDDQGDQQRQRQPGISSHNDHIELSTCDLLVAQEEEFLDQLAKFGLPNLTGSNNEPNSTNDDLKDLILGLTSANSGTITNCDFVSADHSDDYNVDQLNQDTALDGILVAQTNIKPVRPHSFELASHGIEMQQQYSLAKASSTDNGWNNIELDSNSYSLTGDFNNHKSSENENSYTLLATNQPSILKENSAKDNTLFTARENQSSSAITYRNTSFNESESKSTTLNQSFCIRNSFSRSCSAPGGTNGVIQILDYVPNWANTNGGSKVLIIGKWETVKLNYQKPSKYSGHSYRQSYYHEELSKSNSLVHSIEACSEKKTPSEDESVGFTSKSTNAFTVMFDDISVPATQIQENVLRCYAPIHEVGFVSMRVLINSCIISDEVIFEYKPLCTSRPLSTTSGEGQINNSQSIVPTHQQYRQQLSPNSIKSGSLSCATSPSSVNSAETKVLTLAENIISAMHKKNLNPRLYQSDCNHSVNTKFGECFAATTTKSHSDNNCRLPIRPSTLISPRLTSSFDSSSAGYSASNDVVGSIYHNSLSKLGNSLSLNSRDSSSSTQANDINDVTNQHQQTFENVINPSFISNTSVLISDKINDSSGTINDTGNQMQIPAPLNNGQQSNTISIQHPLSIITDSPINRNHQSYQIQQRQLQQSQNIMPSCSNTKAQMMLLTHGNGPQNISHDSQTETSSSGLGSIMSSSPSSSLHSPMSIAPIDSPCSCGHQSSGTPTSADFCEYFQASAKAEESFSCLTLSDYEQQELYEAAKVIQKAYRMYKGRKRQASDITVSIHKDTQPHHRHLHHRLLNLKHHHVPHASSYRDKEMQAATIIQAYYRRYRQYVHYRQSKQQVSNAANHMHASSSNTSKSESLSSISSVEENGLIYTHQGHQSGMNSLNGGKQQSNLQYRQKQLDHRMISSASSSTRRYSQNGLVNRSNNVCGTNETCASFIVESLDISNVSSTAYIDRKRIKTARASSLNPKSQEQSNLYRSEHQH